MIQTGLRVCHRNPYGVLLGVIARTKTARLTADPNTVETRAAIRVGIAGGLIRGKPGASAVITSATGLHPHSLTMAICRSRILRFASRRFVTQGTSQPFVGTFRLAAPTNPSAMIAELRVNHVVIANTLGRC